MFLVKLIEPQHMPVVCTLICCSSATINCIMHNLYLLILAYPLRDGAS